MEELRYFYENHYKSKDGVSFDELSDKQKRALSESKEFLSFQIYSIKISLLRELDEFYKHVDKIIQL